MLVCRRITVALYKLYSELLVLDRSVFLFNDYIYCLLGILVDPFLCLAVSSEQCCDLIGLFVEHLGRCVKEAAETILEVRVCTQIEQYPYIACFFVDRPERIPQSRNIYLALCKSLKFKVSVRVRKERYLAL